jgi:hypothetical protein
MFRHSGRREIAPHDVKAPSWPQGQIRNDLAIERDGIGEAIPVIVFAAAAERGINGHDKRLIAEVARAGDRLKGEILFGPVIELVPKAAACLLCNRLHRRQRSPRHGEWNSGFCGGFRQLELALVLNGAWRGCCQPWEQR